MPSICSLPMPLSVISRVASLLPCWCRRIVNASSDNLVCVSARSLASSANDCGSMA